MKNNILTIYRDRTTENVEIDLPNKCPHCGETMGPIPLVAYSNARSSYHEEEILAALLQCSLCKKYYALEYHPKTKLVSIGMQREYRFDHYSLEEYTYTKNIKITFPKNIDKVSAQYKEIYTQASTAEAMGLNQIAGVGYRKAAEFLIKDYAIFNHETAKEKIEKMFLGAVIDEYLTNFPNIQSLAKGASWIGNDETHYVRKNLEMSIEDMKEFIEAAALFISAEYSAMNATAFTTNS